MSEMLLMENISHSDSLATLMDVVQSRRSVKHYDPNHVMTEAEVTQLLETTLLSPTSFNIQNWRFVWVSDPEIRQQLRAAAWDQAQVTEASALFVVCGDLKAWNRDTERYWQTAPEAQAQWLVSAIRQFYQDNPQLERDEAMRSGGLAAQTLMLTAKAMGYDSCPMVGFDPKAVAEIIQLPADYVLVMMISVGKAVKPAYPRGGQLPLEDVVIRNRFAAV